MTTNYRNSFITVSPDSRAENGGVPGKAGSIAALQLAMLLEHPYAFTSDDLLFEVHAARNDIPEAERAREREAFLAKSHACLRTSPLVKQYGWGLHHDGVGKVAAYGVETEAYGEMCRRPGVNIIAGIRRRKG